MENNKTSWPGAESLLCLATLNYRWLRSFLLTFGLFLALNLGGFCIAKAATQHDINQTFGKTHVPSPLAQAPGAGGESCICLQGLLRLAQLTDVVSSVSDRHENDRIAGIIRLIGETILEGNVDRARGILHTTILECESDGGDVRGCSKWMKTLRGLERVLQSAPKNKVITNSIGMKLVRIPAGEYMMGSLKQEMDWLRLTFKKTWREGHKQWFQDEIPMHPVRFTRPIYMSATEVTVGQYREFVEDERYKTDAEKGDGGMIFSEEQNRWVAQKKWKWNTTTWRLEDDQPVVFVSWNDAKAFCRWLSRKEKRTYRLPTEAEWERACRGGSPWIRYPWGNRLPGDRDTNFGDGSPKLPASLLTANDGYKQIAPVASYPPNGFGLYDMSGNVMEWVEDLYQRDYYEASPLEDPKGSSTGLSRVNKGGNWYASPADGRCAFRGYSGPTMSFWNLGFRVVMEEAEDIRSIVRAEKSENGAHKQENGKASELPPTLEQGLSMFQQAMFAAQQQRWDEAIEDLEKALDIYKRIENYKWMARVKATLAGIYTERDRRYKAKELYAQALSDFRKIGDLNNASLVLMQLLELAPIRVRVVKVKKGSIADKAGIVAGDIIVEYAGDTGFRVHGFKKAVEDYSDAKDVTLSVWNNNQITTHIVPGGELGVAVENIRRPPRQRREPPRRDNRRRRRPQQRRDRRR